MLPLWWQGHKTCPVLTILPVLQTLCPSCMGVQSPMEEVQRGAETAKGSAQWKQVLENLLRTGRRDKKRCPEGRSGTRAGKLQDRHRYQSQLWDISGMKQKMHAELLSQVTRHLAASLGVLQFYCSSLLTTATGPTGETVCRSILNSLVSAGSCPFAFLVLIQKKLHLKHLQTACFELLLNLIVE